VAVANSCRRAQVLPPWRSAITDVARTAFSICGFW